VRGNLNGHRRNQISESKLSQRNKNSATSTALQTKMHRGSVYYLNPIARIAASDFWLQKLKALQSYNCHDD